MLRAGGVRLFLLAILTLLVCAPAAAACAPDSGPNLSNRVVTSTDLSKYPSLECVNFQHADLRGVSFLQADLKTADFRYAIVTGDDFTQATLQDSNFYGAQAARANFGQATMQYANLRTANLQGADFIQTYLQHATLDGSRTSGADFTQADTYDSTGVPSSSAGGVVVIILIALGLLFAVPILIRIRKSSKSKSSSTVTDVRVRGGTSATVPRERYATPSSLLPDASHSSATAGGDDGADEITQLEKLDQMRKSGNLTDDEFDAAKKRILGET